MRMHYMSTSEGIIKKAIVDMSQRCLQRSAPHPFEDRFRPSRKSRGHIFAVSGLSHITEGAARPKVL